MFCIVKGKENLGLGKATASGEKWLVEYFDAPSKPVALTLSVNEKLILPRVLGKNARVFYQNPRTEQWLVGRIREHEDGIVEVRFADRQDVRLHQSHIFVRWKVPISDPTNYLAAFVTETPQYASARSRFQRSYVLQRGAASGMKALLSSAIELEPHQINVIRRVLSDPCQRYLLADEVGLGKTIEAGVVVRQAVLDDPAGHLVMVVTPSSLVQQWRGELSARFGLGVYLDDTVHVMSFDAFALLEFDTDAVSLLVIDEAHHLAFDSGNTESALYSKVSGAAKRIPRLLLLSATPVLRNESGFLRMLHLLDPVVFELENETAFREKIQHRQSLAESVAALEPENALFLDAVLDGLDATLKNDSRLLDLTRRLRLTLASLPDESDPQLRQDISALKAHLGETYRLHRRILRNRRKAIRFLTSGRRCGETWFAANSDTKRIENLLEEWRIARVDADMGPEYSDKESDVEFYWSALVAVIEQPAKLEKICLDRIAVICRNSKIAGAEKEETILRQIISISNHEYWVENRLIALVDGLRNQLADSSRRVIVFCTNEETADVVFSALNDSFPRTVARHLNEDQDATGAWKEFLDGTFVRILVCGQYGEEGLNLQGGRKVIVHFNMPLHPNRIEQRIGRADRYCAGYPVESVTICDVGSSAQEAWLGLLKNGFAVFDRSISSLQYLVELELSSLPNSCFEGGPAAITELALRLGGESGDIAKEVRLIDQQDALDELAPLSEEETEALLDVDGEWREIREAALGWCVDTLMFQLVETAQEVHTKPVETPYRFQYVAPGNPADATLIPLIGFLDSFVGALDFNARGGGRASQPRTHVHASHRTTAIRRNCRPLRYGDEFIEAMQAFSLADDRGRSFAMWRWAPKGEIAPQEVAYFRYDFAVETAIGLAESVLASSDLGLSTASRSAISRRADVLFPPYIESIWVDEDGVEVKDPIVKSLLELPYNKDETTGEYQDLNLRADRLRSLKLIQPQVFENWARRCENARDCAKSSLEIGSELTRRKAEAMHRSVLAAEQRFAQLESRIQLLDGNEAESERHALALEKMIVEALHAGISAPSIRVDIAGVMFLSRAKCPISARRVG